MIYGYSIYEASGDLKTYIIICTYGLNESNIVCNDSYSVSVVQIYSGLENCIPWTCWNQLTSKIADALHLFSNHVYK